MKPAVTRSYLVLSLCLTVIAPAHAQRRFRLTLGTGTQRLSYIQPNAGLGPHYDEDYNTALGLSYDLARPRVGRDRRVTLSVFSEQFFYFSLGGRNIGGDLAGDSGLAVSGLGASARYDTPLFFIGAGVGLYRITIPGEVSVVNGEAVGSRRRISPGLTLFAGGPARSSVFFQVGYTHLLSGPVEPGTNLRLGVRF